MGNVQGVFLLSAGGKEYKLFLGMSVLGHLQAEFGEDVLEQLDAPPGASKDWMPNLKIVTGLFMGALQRYHSDVADRWLVDDILAENANVLGKLLTASFPSAPKAAVGSKTRGKARTPRKAA